MQIREANYSDIPEILRVLKASLGETSSEKTEKVWKYKHIENPFGESLVLVAEEDAKIIGVRAFMRWKWQKENIIFSAFRAVDTATHPDHQGKGIFKKLTLKALEIGKERGDHFVFNTPNIKSKPGYLKMGWEEVGKLKIHLVPVNPLHWGNNNFSFENPVNILKVNNNSMLKNWNLKLSTSGKLFTPKTTEYLEWRYSNNPLLRYRILDENNLFIAGYVKQQTHFRELRISELIFSTENSKKIIKKTLRTWAKEFGVHFISIQVPGYKNIFHREISGEFGPVFTFKQISESLETDTFLDSTCWDYSIGDLELF